MSETDTTPPTAAEIDGKLFEAGYRKARAAWEARGRRSGPEYHEGGSCPSVWYGQVFEREITPAGSVECGEPMRVGATQNGLDVAVIASHKNSGAITCAAGATITLTTLVADSPDGTFSETGPSICVKAPAGGISADPDQLVCKFAIGNFNKPWLKAKLDFSGSISGGTVDCVLHYEAR